MAYEIQNHLGEVIMASITEEEYLELQRVAVPEGFTYYEYGTGVLDKFKEQEANGSDISQSRIYKKIVEG